MSSSSVVSSPFFLSSTPFPDNISDGDVNINISSIVIGAPLCATCLSPAVTIIFSVFICAVVLVGVLGNAFVVAVIVTDRKLLNSSVNLFLLNLALADMGNQIFCSPDVAQFLMARGWLLHPWMCPVLRFLQEYFLYASVLLQMSIGIERFMAICSPLRMQRFSRTTTYYFLVAAWGIAAIFGMPYLFKQKVQTHPRQNMDYCAWDLPGLAPFNKKLIKYAEFFILYMIPLILLTLLYTIMCRRLWGKSRTIANEAQQMVILRLRRSVVKMLIICMLLYFIFYTPIQAIFLIDDFFQDLRVNSHLPHELRFIMNMLPMASSTANPIVYIMCCRHFHMRFMQLLGWFSQCLSSPPEKYQTVLTDTDKSYHRRAMSRSPYVSFRKSFRKHQTLSVTLV